METTVVDAAVVAGIVGIVQVAKPFVPDERVWAVLALVLGVAWGVGSRVASGGDILSGAMLGVMTGLAASGAFSQGKTFAGR